MKNERAKKIICSVLDFYLFICVCFKKKRNFESSFAILNRIINIKSLKINKTKVKKL